MGPRHFVACDTGHSLVEGFELEDFKFWYDEACGHVSPILTTVLEAEDWTPILSSGDGGWGRPWGSVPVAAEKAEGEGVWRICQIALGDRLQTNPVANRFARLLVAPADQPVLENGTAQWIEA